MTKANVDDWPQPRSTESRRDLDTTTRSRWCLEEFDPKRVRPSRTFKGATVRASHLVAPRTSRLRLALEQACVLWCQDYRHTVAAPLS